jgi:hypothetical protein
MAIDESLRTIFAAVGELVAAGGGGAVIAYAIFRSFGNGWLDQHFKKQLEELKHAQEREMAQLRHDINSEFSRISKIHQKEFEILPEAWNLLHMAHGRVADLVGRLKFHPDFTNMSEDRFIDLVTSCPLSEVQKSELKTETTAGGRRQYYLKAIREVELTKAQQAQVALGNYLVLNSIFMTDDLRKQFREMNTALALIISNELDDDHSIKASTLEQTNALWSQTKDMVPSIESAVQKRLHYDQA